MWRLLRGDPRFRRIFAAETVSSFGDSAMFLSLAIWAKDLTGSNGEAGVVFLIITVPGLFGSLLGDLVDRVRRKPLLLRIYAGMAVLVLSLLFVRGPGQLWIIYTVTFAYGLMFATPAWPALLKDLLQSEDAADARSLLITVRQGVRIVSPAVGAGVYAAFGGHALILIGTSSFLVASLVLASIKVVESESERSGERFLTSVTAGYRYVRRVPLLLNLTAAQVGFMAVIGLLETAAFAAIDKGLGQQPPFLGIVASVQGGGSVVGGILAGLFAKRATETKVSGLGYALIAVGLPLCVLGNVALFMAGVILLGVGLPFLNVALATAQHLYTPSRLQGRVNAAVGTVSGGAQTVSIAAGAALIGVVDYRIMYLLMAAAALASAVTVTARHVPIPDVVPSVADALPVPDEDLPVPEAGVLTTPLDGDPVRPDSRGAEGRA